MLRKEGMKCVLVGDGSVGKTCLFAVYAKGQFPSGYIPTVMDNYAVTVFAKGKRVTLEVWDTAGQEDFAAIRELSYPNTDGTWFFVYWLIKTNQRILVQFSSFVMQ